MPSNFQINNLYYNIDGGYKNQEITNLYKFNTLTYFINNSLAYKKILTVFSI